MPRKNNKKNVIMNVNNQDWYLNDANMQHFQTLTPDQQEFVKQLMLLKNLQNHYD